MKGRIRGLTNFNKAFEGVFQIDGTVVKSCLLQIIETHEHDSEKIAIDFLLMKRVLQLEAFEYVLLLGNFFSQKLDAQIHKILCVLDLHRLKF